MSPDGEVPAAGESIRFGEGVHPIIIRMILQGIPRNTHTNIIVVLLEI